MSPRGAGLRVLHLQPGHPSRDANALHPPPAAWHHCDSAGMSVPLQGSESPPPPPEGCCLSPGPPVLPKGGDANPDAFLEEGCACAPPGAGPSSPSPLLKGLPPPPPASPHFSGTSSSHGIPRHDGRRRRACLPDTPQLCRGGPGFAVGSKVGREGLRLFTQAWGAPGVGRFVPNCSPLCFPYRHGEHGVRGLGGVSLIPLFLSPPYTGMGGLSPEPGLGSGPARSVSVRLSPTRSGGGSCPFAVS